MNAQFNNDEQMLCIEQTKKWVETVVVGLNFCPFAKRELDANKVRWVVCDSDKQKDVLEHFLEECIFLDKNQSVETTLLILNYGFDDFFAYLDVVDLCEELLEMESYTGTYQVASFHPEYCFAEEDIDDAANFTNRSPYPMLHILRELSLEKAIDNHPDVDAIPQNNINKTRSLGLDVMKKLFLEAKVEAKKTPQ